MRTLAISSLIALGCFQLTATESLVVITSKPRIEQRGLFTYLVIADANQRLEMVWGMPPEIKFKPVTLEADRVYVFTVAQKPHRSITIPELRKVQLNGETIYDIEFCEVHKTKMEYRALPIGYGLVGYVDIEPAPEIERQLFPHRREHLDGGCVVSPSSPKSEERFVCMDCKASYEKWKAENKKTE